MCSFSFGNLLALECGEGDALCEALLANRLDVGYFHVVYLPEFLELREFGFELLQLSVHDLVELGLDLFSGLLGQALRSQLRFLLDLVEDFVGERGLGSLLRIDEVELLVVLRDDELIGIGVGLLLVLRGLCTVGVVADFATGCALDLLLPHLPLHAPRRSLLHDWWSVRLRLVGTTVCSPSAFGVIWSCLGDASDRSGPLLRASAPHGQLLGLEGLLLLLEQLLSLLDLPFFQASCKDGHLREQGIRSVHEDACTRLLAEGLRLGNGIGLSPRGRHGLLLVAADLGQHVLRQRQLQELEHALCSRKLP